MPKLKIVEVSERELEQLLVNDPACIEEGVQVLDRQVPTDTGSLDILATDADSVLCIIELKVTVDEGHLAQGLRYYDWARINLEAIARHYPNKVDPNQEPALILIAPGFSQNLIRIAKYVDVPLDFRQYRVLQMPDGEREVVCTSVEIPEKRWPPRIPTQELNLAYIESGQVRTLCEKAIEELGAMGVELRPKQNYWFSCWCRGKRFMYLGSKKKFFVIEVERPDGSWSGRNKVATQDEWERVMRDEILPVYRTLGGTEADAGVDQHT
jgi:hypothetical protein